MTDAGKLDILAYVLSVNGAPAGKEELSIELPALEAITIVRKGGAPEGVSNFNLVQLVGCLRAGRGQRLETYERERTGRDSGGGVDASRDREGQRSAAGPPQLRSGQRHQRISG